MSKRELKSKATQKSLKKIKNMILHYGNGKPGLKWLIAAMLIAALVFLPFANTLAPHVIAGADTEKVAQITIPNEKVTAQETATEPMLGNEEPMLGNTDKVMKKEEKAAFDNAVKITFCGDMMLLNDQIEKAYDGANYNFDGIFKYAKNYIESADLSIGVLDGTLAGKSAGYSTGNPDEKENVCLNYPDEFATSIKNAGFDLVTTAGDHLLDKDVQGEQRTLSVLDAKQIDHVGSYRNQEEKDKIKIVEVNGLKVAVLAYTYGVIGKDEGAMLDGSDSYLTSVIVNPKSSYFDKVKEYVKCDFEKAKAMNPDLIIVLPHMGTQYSHETDAFQHTWNQLFVQYGADIIFGDHSQAVQPITYVKKSERTDGRQKNAIIVNSTGNFTNSYRKNDCDATGMVEVYVSKTSKDVIGASVVPMWIQYTSDCKYQTVPIYTLMTDQNLLNTVTSYDRERISQVQKLVTKVMVGETLGIEMINPRYYVTPEGFVEDGIKQLALTDKEVKSTFYSLLTTNKNVCFVGDSITAGSRDGGYGWYEPLTQLISGKVTQKAIGGSTTKTILGSIKEEGISPADLYVIAIGTNDIRYRNREICAMTPMEYVQNISEIVSEIKKTAPNAKFALIAPWRTQNNDPHCVSSIEERGQLYTSFSEQLKVYCETCHFTYIDPNPYIKSILDVQSPSKYLVDYIHPSAKEGIRLYSMAVLTASIPQQQ
jgi:poly-gamma-glutamate capsule biosynthesis protein CapA/YwtB (metallophosphatase superfamily)/lysophospholipase L1-like esterase